MINHIKYGLDRTKRMLDLWIWTVKGKKVLSWLGLVSIPYHILRLFQTIRLFKNYISRLSF